MARRDRLGQKDRAADDRSFADHRVAAEDGGVGVDRHIVFDGRVTLGVADQPSFGVFGKTHRPERHPLVELDALANHRGLTDHHTGGVVDEERLPDRSTRVDVHTGFLMDVFGHQARQQRHIHLVQRVGHPMDHDRQNARVGEHRLVRVARRRIAVVGRLHIGREYFANTVDLLQKPIRDRLGRPGHVGDNVLRVKRVRSVQPIAVFDRLGDQLFKSVANLGHQTAGVIIDVVRRQGFFGKVTGKQQVAQKVEQCDGPAAIGKNPRVDMADRGPLAVTVQHVAGLFIQSRSSRRWAHLRPWYESRERSATDKLHGTEAASGV